jgi:hypothetical protein
VHEAFMGAMKNEHEIYVSKYEGNRLRDDLGIDGKIILRLILRK